MSGTSSNRISEVLKKHGNSILTDWVGLQAQAQGGRIREAELREQSTTFIKLLEKAVAGGNLANIFGSEWDDVRELLTEVSRSRSLQGYSPSETATFVFSIKQPFFARLSAEIRESDELARETWRATELLDKLGLLTTEIYLKTREEVILRQQQEMMELSTPVVKLWEGIVALPLIGTLDSARTQVVMETLLQKIVSTSAEIAIIDITGVPTVDTLVAQHLIKTVTAARLMGAECIISGIRPQIAQTIVHLGVNLADITTKASLADAFTVAMRRLGLIVSKPASK